MPIPIDGVRVGHWTDEHARTGCTVVELPEGTVASYECRGGAPAARELTLLEPDKSVTTIDALLLTGGSAFGLAAADGVMRRMEETGRGVPTPAGPVPIVSALGLFDLAVGDATVRPGPEQGYAAAASVSTDAPLTGQLGAGTGAYTSHWRGPDGARPGGLSAAERRMGDVVVWALVAVNAYGDIDLGDAPVSTEAVARLQEPFGFGGADGGGTDGGGTDGAAAVAAGDRTHTTIGVVVTNARLDKVGCHIVAQGAHDGLARSLTPPHTRFDGDAFVAAATGVIPAHVDVVRLLALAAVTDAIRAAAEGATGGD
ncbi:P1 family peptidase [Flexivirga sp. ID2601S]|uniref:P1 family peptidase n=1 Tax=Flexivirga aerilata TaxID=1656889 RepID=A0A849AII4_9MICO|nr:P1 family peptidase [Flexivirga aerilata]NNG38230.1 P1 family peptidase [Flexivirga aerilata]